MNKPLVPWTLLFVLVSVSTVSVAGDIFDQHIEHFRSRDGKVMAVRVADAPIVHIVRTSFPTPELPNPFPATKLSGASDSTPSRFYYFMRAFSEPIRLSIENSVGVSNRGQLEKLP